MAGMKKTLLSAALVTLLAAGCFPVPLAPPAPKADSAAASAPTPPAPEDPYPECAAVRKWFAENLGDPKSLEVISWRRDSYYRLIPQGPPRGPGGVRPGTPPPPPPEKDPRPFTRLTVKYRAANAFGALAVAEKVFFFRDGELYTFLPPP
jgi:hypothetical protein